MKDFDTYMQWSASECRTFRDYKFKELDLVEEPTEEELEELAKLEKLLEEKGYVVR